MPLNGRKPRNDLKAAFARRGLKQRGIAAKVQISEGHLNDVLNGRRPLTHRLARDISRATGISLTIIKGEDELAPQPADEGA